MTPLVFLHGFLGSPSEWDPVISQLKWSGPKHPLPLSAASHWTQGLERIVEALPPTCVLIGYSMGARIALGVALSNPLRVRGLCLIAGHPGLGDADRESRYHHDQEVAARVVRQPWAAFLDDWYRQEVFASVDEVTRVQWVQQRASLDRGYHAELLRCYSVGRQPDFWPQLRELRASTVVVVGEDDKKYVEIAQRMRQRATQLQIQVVPSAGHAVHRERPREFAAILQTFLTSLDLEKTGHE